MPPVDNTISALTQEPSFKFSFHCRCFYRVRIATHTMLAKSSFHSCFLIRWPAPLFYVTGRHSRHTYAHTQIRALLKKLPKLTPFVPQSASPSLMPPPEGACRVLGSSRPPLAPSPDPFLSVGVGVFPLGQSVWAAGRASERHSFPPPLRPLG
jgi:hypothetical protein